MSEAAQDTTVDTTQNQDQAPSVTELDALEKFKFQGEEYTPETLRSAVLRQSDYTKKTQEITAERKFYENLDADLDRVLENPALTGQFRKIYPPKFHRYLERLTATANRDDGQEGKQQPDPNEDRIAKLEARLAKQDEATELREAEIVNKELDSKFATLSQKYPYANTDSIEAAVLGILQKDKDYQFTEATWDRLFKQDHAKNEKHFKTLYEKQIKEQLERGKKGADSPAGGAAPGRAPARAKTFAEATEMMIKDLGAQ